MIKRELLTTVAVKVLSATPEEDTAGIPVYSACITDFLGTVLQVKNRNEAITSVPIFNRFMSNLTCSYYIYDKKHSLKNGVSGSAFDAIDVIAFYSMKSSISASSTRLFLPTSRISYL